MYICTKTVPKMNSYPNTYKFIVKNSLESTNTYAKELISRKDCEDRTVIVAESQTKGRGQHTNMWESEDGKNLTFSIVYFPKELEASLQFYFSRAIALGVADYLSEKLENVSIKWPNDIYVGEKKIAGILIENTVMGPYISSTICGIGININQEVFYSDAPNPISLKQITEKEYDLKVELDSLVGAIEKRYCLLENNELEKLNKDYNDYLFRKSGFHLYREGDMLFKAKIVEITAFGQMVLEKEDGSKKAFSFKEVGFEL